MVFAVISLAFLAASAFIDRTLAVAMGEAGSNSKELHTALAKAPRGTRKAIEFLIVNMPKNDLESLSADLLLTNARLAYQAMKEVKWGRAVPQEVFLNSVLPYASLDETREDWRTDFYHRYIDLAKSCKTSGEVALKLNEKLFSDVKVQYHATKRPKPNQSPSESTQAGYASCTGLSILLVDACRSVGVPARIAGTAMWFDDSGNHTWVEIWDGGEWKYLGAAEPSPFNQTWFSEKAAKADPSDPTHAIYATIFRRTGEHFVMTWRTSSDSVPGINVTYRYLGGKEAPLALSPRPTEAMLLEGTFVVDERPIVQASSNIQDVVQKLWKVLAEKSSVGVKVENLKPGSNKRFELVLDHSRSDLGEHGFELNITPERVKLVAKTQEGLICAMSAIDQITKPSSAGAFLRLPCVKIKDVR